jgi:membrane protease YdiL (CAAX protease family)
MWHYVPIISGLILTGYVSWEFARTGRRYRRFKQAVASGEAGARTQLYRKILMFEWVTAALAVTALRFDPARFNPARLELKDTSFSHWWHSLRGPMEWSFLMGVVSGVALAVVASLWISLRMKRRRVAQANRASPTRKRKVLPDFRDLIPVSARERWLFAAVAISAGICEETVFRGWLLETLHGVIGLKGGMMVLAAAAIFGLGHHYQGIAGVIVTSLLGLVLCGLYVGTGTLLVPMALHVLIDLRFAVFPSTFGQVAQPRPA